MNIKAVAEKAGVSITTVSRVLNHPETVSEETRSNVLKVMKQLNFTPNWFARNIQSGRTNMIGLILPDILDPSNTQLAKGIGDVTQQKQTNIILCNTEYDAAREREYVEALIGRNIDGLIIMSSRLKKSELKKIKNKGLPLVLIGKSDYEDCNMVYTDFFNVSKEAAGYLAESGRKKIAVILAEKQDSENAEKLEGCKEALLNQGMKLEEQYIVKADNSIEGGFVGAGKLLSLNEQPDAIFAFTDTMAFGVIERLKQDGVDIPSEIAIIGFNDLATSMITEPKLTTVAKPSYRMGLVAARLLFDMIEEDSGEEEVQKIMIQSKLKIRKSCGNKERVKEIW